MKINLPIKPTELRLSNIVFCEQLGECRVVSLAMNNLAVSKGARGIVLGYSDIERVKVTELILSEYHFQCNENQVWSRHGFNIVPNGESFFYSGRNLVEFTYLHELQNLYFHLMGIEM
jgi:hypothetical protein